MTVDRQTLDPRRTALVLFDLLEGFRAAAEEAGAIVPLVRLADECRRRGMPVFHTIADHHPSGVDYGRTLTDTDRDDRRYGRHEEPPARYSHDASGRRILAELGPADGDEVIRKHRWNAFFQTHLELALRTRSIDTVLLAGGSTHVGVAATAYGARDRDFHVVVVRDGCTGRQPQRDLFLDSVFPRMARVRTVGEVVAMLDQDVPEDPT
jgi:nicotinamidase-related amidase